MANKHISRSFINKLLRTDVVSASVLSKLVQSPTITEGTKESPNFKYTDPNSSYYSPAEGIAKRFDASKDTLRLFKDLELAAAIYGSMVVTSGDLSTTLLKYVCEYNGISPAIRSKINQLVKSVVERDYDTNESLGETVKELLIGKGAVARVVLPENSLDNIINGHKNPSSISVEDMAPVYSNGAIQSMGLIGPLYRKQVVATSVGLEGFDVVTLINNRSVREVREPTFPEIEFIDNFNVLKMPALEEAVSSEKGYSSIYQSAQPIDGTDEEENDKVVPADVFAPLSRPTEAFTRVLSDIELERDSLSKPLTFEIPAESVIPVIVPGNPTKRRGYYIPLDGNHNFITVESKMDDDEKKYDEEMQSGEISSDVMKRLRDKITDPDAKQRKAAKTEVVLSRFKQVVEQELVESLNAGLFHKGTIELGDNNDLMYTMLLRVLAGKKTRMLFIPNAILSYYAIKYDEDGIGMNVLEGMCELNAMRGALLYSKVSATIRKNLRATNVKIGLDPRDQDPAKTIKLAVNEVLKANQFNQALSYTSPADLAAWSHRAGYTFSYDNHPGLPQVTFDYTDIQPTRVDDQDETTEENIRDQQYNAFGLTVEQVDASSGEINFATTDNNNRKLLLLRVKKTRDLLSLPLTNEVRSIMMADPVIFNGIAKLLKNEKVVINGTRLTPDRLYRQVVDSMVCSISGNEEDLILKAASDNYNTYSDALDKALEAWTGEDLLGSYFTESEDSDMAKDISRIMKAHLLREYQVSRGYFSEISQILTANSDVDGIMSIGDASTAHNKLLIKSITDIIGNSKVDLAKLRNSIIKSKEWIEKKLEEGEEVEGDDADEDIIDDGSPTSAPDDDTTEEGDTDADADEPTDDDEPADDTGTEEPDAP